MFFDAKAVRIHVFDPKSARIHVFRPEKYADPCVSTRKVRGSMFFDLENTRIHVFRSQKHADILRSENLSTGVLCWGNFLILTGMLEGSSFEVDESFTQVNTSLEIQIGPRPLELEPAELEMEPEQARFGSKS